MAKAKIKLGDETKKPFLAAGRIVRELAALSPKGREIALAMVADYDYDADQAAADPRQIELPVNTPEESPL